MSVQWIPSRNERVYLTVFGAAALGTVDIPDGGAVGLPMYKGKARVEFDSGHYGWYPVDELKPLCPPKPAEAPETTRTPTSKTEASNNAPAPTAAAERGELPEGWVPSDEVNQFTWDACMRYPLDSLAESKYGLELMVKLDALKSENERLRAEAGKAAVLDDLHQKNADMLIRIYRREFEKVGAALRLNGKLGVDYGTAQIIEEIGILRADDSAQEAK